MPNNKRQQEEPVTKQYEPSDYDHDSELSSGLAMTHEQATDAYTEGTVDGEIDDINGKNEKIRRGGFDERK